jgi:hypothetical protein
MKWNQSRFPELRVSNGKDPFGQVDIVDLEFGGLPNPQPGYGEKTKQAIVCSSGLIIMHPCSIEQAVDFVLAV